MPIDVGSFTTEVTVVDGELPLSSEQVERLVQLILRRLEAKQREEMLRKEATTLRSQSSPHSGKR